MKQLDEATAVLEANGVNAEDMTTLEDQTNETLEELFRVYDVPLEQQEETARLVYRSLLNKVIEYAHTSDVPVDEQVETLLDDFELGVGGRMNVMLAVEDAATHAEAQTEDIQQLVAAIRAEGSSVE